MLLLTLRRRAPRGAALAGALLSALLLAAAPAPPARQETAAPRPGDGAGQLLAVARAHAAAEDWWTAADLAQRARGLAPRGSDPWFEAAALEAAALYWRWEQEALVALGEEVAVALAELEQREPGVRRSVLGPMPPLAAGHVLEVYVPFAVALIAQGRSADALGILAPIPDWVLRGAVPATFFPRMAALAQTRALLALGEPEGRRRLELLMDLFPGTTDAAIACVLLQDLAGPDGYRGKYEAEPLHRGCRERLRASLPALRARAAAALGCDEEILGEALVGIADHVPERGSEAGFCHYDPRRGWERPVVVLGSEALALGILPLETLTLHELAHAGPALELGLAFERLPPWVREGIACHAAGELEDTARDALVGFWMEEPDLLLDACVEDLRPRLADPARHQGEELARSLALAVLEEEPGPGGIRRLLDALRSGRGLEQALEDATGREAEEVRRRAAQHAALRLWSELEPAREDLRALRALRNAETERVLAVTTRIASGEAAPLARALALQGRAEALDALGRFGEAAGAWEALLADPARLGPQASTARLGVARALARGGRADEARPKLAALVRDALGQGVRAEAESLLAELEREGGD